MTVEYYNLFLDDIRDPIHVKQALHGSIWEEFPSHYSWEVVRSYAAFVNTIKKQGMPARIAFDHDLSIEDQNKQDYADFKELTGLHCAKWLVDYCIDNNVALPDFYVHSFNPVGRMNIANYLTRFKETQGINKEK